MALNQKAIKSRITSVKNTKKITKAMEMVSAAKMRRAIDAALNTRTYATLARELMEHLSLVDGVEAPLLQRRSVKNLLVVLISSNRGLCGSFNSNLAKALKEKLIDLEHFAAHNIRKEGDEIVLPEKNVTVSILGGVKRSAAFAKGEGYELVGVYDSISEKPQLEDILPVAKQVIEGFVSGTFDKVAVAYTDFYSSIQQVPHIRTLLPVSGKSLEKIERTMAKTDYADKEFSVKPSSVDIETYLFEPNTETILNEVLPRLVEVQLYQALLESAASEHSARMIAMKNASEAAGDMINQLTLESNKARQAAITQEIAEIAGGAAALA